MNESGNGFWSVAEGLGLLLSTQTFAARALLGSLLAIILAAIVSRFGLLRSPRARRVVYLGPVIAAGTAGFLSVGDSFLPPLLVVSGGEVADTLQVFGVDFNVRSLNYLLIAYVAVASFLVLRRAFSHAVVAMCMRRSLPIDDARVQAVVRRVSSKLGITAPPVLAVYSCPGGAFTTGVRRPVVAIDPELISQLDDRELEGLVAHELAHISRRDVGLNIAVGLARDVAFFLPALHLATRWLRNVQEHAADDAASEATGRPAALASSIMKVWEGASRSGTTSTAIACATMVPSAVSSSGALPLPAGMGTRLIRRRSLRGGAKDIAERVVRLIDRAPVSRGRERAELAVTLTALAAVLSATVFVPSMASGDLLLAQWRRPAPVPVEAPALATFRVLASSGVASTTSVTDAALAGAVTERGPACPACVRPETTANWLQGTRPAAPARANGWAGDGFIWQDSAISTGGATRAAVPLWGVDASSTRLGFFLVNERVR